MDVPYRLLGLCLQDLVPIRQLHLVSLNHGIIHFTQIVSHPSLGLPIRRAVDSEEELSKIDMLPKVKDKHFLTPELAPLFTTDEKDLLQIWGTITRIADGNGLASDSGAHGHRQYGKGGEWRRCV